MGTAIFFNFYLLQLDIRLYDRRKISGQVEFQSECIAFRSPNKKASRFKIFHNSQLVIFAKKDGSQLTLT